MKKILFMLLAATTLFSSCSSDDDTINNGGNNTPDTKKYTVNLNVKSAGFEVDKAPLKSFTNEDSKSTYNFQVVVYKQTGEVYSDTLYLPGSLSKLLKEDGSLPLSLNLPQGDYHVAIMYTLIILTNPNYTPETFKLTPANFYTDTYGGGALGAIMGGDGANISNYYQSIDISVPNVNTENIPVVLDPMWSTVEVIIEDNKTFQVPAKTVSVQVDVDPSYTKYSLSTKLAIKPELHDVWQKQIYRIESIRDRNIYSVKYYISKTDSLNNELKIKVRLYDENIVIGDADPVFFEKIIPLNTQVENGQNYKITGKLGNLTDTDNNQSMNISLGSFAKDDVNIEF